MDCANSDREERICEKRKANAAPNIKKRSRQRSGGGGGAAVFKKVQGEVKDPSQGEMADWPTSDIGNRLMQKMPLIDNEIILLMKNLAFPRFFFEAWARVPIS